MEEDRGGDDPCFAHRLVDGHAVDPEVWRDVQRFRKAERERLYDRRRTMPQADREVQTARVVDAVQREFPDLSGASVAAYWPIRGELDLRAWMGRVAEVADVALPVVVARGHPAEFHRWTPGRAMTRGFWNIPVPEAAEPLLPDVVIVPLVGLDDGRYRLGNGGGYYDMTLASLARAPLVVGVGQDFCRIGSIFPQPWDVPMDIGILGDGAVMHRDGDQER
jgi:5-formyltetrahydrofolate cyclo-ligase